MGDETPLTPEIPLEWPRRYDVDGLNRAEERVVIVFDSLRSSGKMLAMVEAILAVREVTDNTTAAFYNLAVVTEDYYAVLRDRKEPALLPDPRRKGWYRDFEYRGKRRRY